MKELGIFALAAGSLLGSATPPRSMLDYDLTGFREWTLSCPESLDGCEVISRDSADVSPAPAADPILTTERLESDDRTAVASAEIAAPAVTKPPVPAPASAPPEAPGLDPAVLPEAPSAAGVRILVSIPAQKAFVFDDGELVATTPVSTGKRGHETPTGTFRILQKKVHHRSNLYSNAPMPFMQRLTNGGIALHAGELPGYPASHGCIRMPWSFAKKLFGMTNFQTLVTITAEHPATPEEALDLI